jgi:hypothetical protein
MILLPRAVRIYVASYPVNLRKSFDGLMNEVRSVLCHDPLLCVELRYVASLDDVSRLSSDRVR